MDSMVQTDVSGLLLSQSSFGPQEIQRITAATAADRSCYSQLREAVGQLSQQGDLSPAMKVRLGVGNFLLGRYKAAIEQLTNSDSGALARFFMAKAYFALEQYDDAVESYRAALKAGYPGDDCHLGEAESLRYLNKPEEALKILDDLSGAVEQTAEYLYQRGATVAALGGNPQEVVALYERAVESDSNHPGALFGLAIENDRRGNDDDALALYERCARRTPSNVGSLLNLGMMYEDRNRHEEAEACYRRILESFPDHPQARLYVRDASASRDQEYDEDAQRRQDRLSQVLAVPVTDFELSVRSRNCLQRMGIGSLGDLTRITEAQLLASKNFGETSLVEIREMMNSKGLEIGQFASDRRVPDFATESASLSPDEQALLNKPVTELNLSVRARKCMIRLGIGTIGELVRRTGDELLESKNFGVTSLNEVREKLQAHGLRLRGD